MSEDMKLEYNKERKAFVDICSGLDFDISRSKHYSILSPEPIDVINQWNLNFNAGNVVKYISRYMAKGDAIGDLRKAKQYIDFEIARLQNGQG